MKFELVLGYLFTGLVWGVTNAFMERGTKQKEQQQTSNEVTAGVKMFANLAFLVPFLLNQGASILNNFLVAKSDLSIAVPAVNCVTFLVTFIT
jgi:hypothetical protein